MSSEGDRRGESDLLDEVLAVAYQFNGALSVGELLSSGMLYQSALLVLARARGTNEEESVGPEVDMLSELGSRSTAVG